MSTLKLITLVAALTLAGAAQANGPAGYDPLAFVQADIAQARLAAKAEPAKKELAKAGPAKAEPKKLDWRKIIHPVAQGNGPAGYDPLAFVKAEESAQPAPQAPQYAARTTK